MKINGWLGKDFISDTTDILNSFVSNNYYGMLGEKLVFICIGRLIIFI